MQGGRFFKETRAENGEVMIESILMVTATFVILMFLLALGFLMYQQTAIQIAADDAAAKIAQTYRLVNADLTTGKISVDELVAVDLYRYGPMGGSFEAENKAKTANYINNRMHAVSFALEVVKPNTEMRVEGDGLGRSHLVIHVESTYKMPFGSFLKLIGMEDELVFKASSVADCVDILEYYNSVSFAYRCFNYLDKNSYVSKAISQWMKVTNHDYS